MNGFAAVARKEEEPIRAALENRWAQPSILPAFQLPRYSANRLTPWLQPRRAQYHPARRRLQAVLGTQPHNLPRSKGWQHGQHLGDERLEGAVLVALRHEHDHRDAELVDVLLE